jgi:multiple sugar transport system substrate-binding protein
MSINASEPPSTATPSRDGPETSETAPANIGKRQLLTGAAALGAAATLGLPKRIFAQTEKNHPLAGKSIHMSILGVAGWLPSSLSVDMSPNFAKYAKDRYGYGVSFSFAGAPFGALFQKGATSFATKSQEYNIMISDSQWLGALATPKWIVKLNDIIAKNKDLNIEWYSPTIRSSYQVFPDGTDNLWGFPQVGDVVGIFIRKDWLEAPGEADAFQKRYGRKLPVSWEDWEALDFEDFRKVIEFFNRPEKGYNGIAMQYSREYDACSCPVMSFIRSMGGDIWDPKTGQIEGIYDTQVNARALEAYKSMLKYNPPGALNYFIAEVVDAFTQGKVFAAWQWVATGATMIPKQLEGKVLVVPPPGFKVNGELKRNYIIGGQPWVINAFNDPAHMRVAIDFMKWWYLPETQQDYLHRGGMPCDKATLSRPDFDSIYPWNRAYKYMLLRSSDFWHDPKYSEMLSIQQEAFTGYMSGQISDPAHALKYIACKQQAILFEEGTASREPSSSCTGIRL